jgi:hypothetical protein
MPKMKTPEADNYPSYHLLINTRKQVDNTKKLKATAPIRLRTTE